MAETVFNEGSIDGTNFRIESDDNANMFFVDGANDRIGIGTASPRSIFDVQGASGASLLYEDAGEGLLSLINSSGTALVRLEARSGENNYINNGGALGILTTSPNVGSANSERGVLTISSTDNGSANNYAVLEVQGHSINSDGALGVVSFLDHSTNCASIQVNTDDSSQSSGKMLFLTKAAGGSITERMRITSDGHVQIPDNAKFRVGTGQDMSYYHTGTDSYLQNTTGHLYLHNNAASKFINILQEGASGGIIFHTNNTERMRISAGGVVGIGDDSATMKLTVVTDHSSGYVASFHNDGNNADRYGLRISAGTDNGSGTNYHISCMDGDNDLEGALRVSSGTFALYDNSDRRLKDNIRDTKINGTDIVNSMKVRDFEWKKSGLTETAGFVAQELKESFEPASPDSEDDLYEGKPQMMAVSRDRLVPVLVKAVQELSIEVKDVKILKEKVEDLEKKNVMRFGN